MENIDMQDIDSLINEENEKTKIDTENTDTREKFLPPIKNPQEQHIATVLLLDTSVSMSGDKISELNNGLSTFKEEAMKDPSVRNRGEFAIVTFDSNVEVIQNFSPIENIEIPILKAKGEMTCMGHAIIKAIDMVNERKKIYRDRGISYLRPWIFMITDGEPNDMWPNGEEKDVELWNKVIKTVHEGNSEDKNIGKKFVFFTVGVGGANMKILTQIAPPDREPIRLNPDKWKEMFLWLVSSQSKGFQLKPGEQMSTEDPTDPKKGWGKFNI